jgi:hypothetical protein
VTGDRHGRDWGPGVYKNLAIYQVLAMREPNCLHVFGGDILQEPHYLRCFSRVILQEPCNLRCGLRSLLQEPHVLHCGCHSDCVNRGGGPHVFRNMSDLNVFRRVNAYWLKRT